MIKVRPTQIIVSQMKRKKNKLISIFPSHQKINDADLLIEKKIDIFMKYL